MSEGGTIEVKIRGLDSLRYVIAEIPTRIPIDAIVPTLTAVKDYGVEEMRMYIMRSTGEKATGRLANSIQGVVDQTSPSSWKLEIGTDVEYGGYVARGVGPAVINRPIQIMPGRWRFIGTRPPIPAKPFLEYTQGVVLDKLKEVFVDKVGDTVRNIDSEQRGLKDKEEP